MISVMVDLDRNFVERDGIRVNLVADHAETLFALHAKCGRIVSIAELASALWGMPKLQPRTWDQCIKANIYQVRKAIEPLGGKIENIKFQGYILTWEEWREDNGKVASRFAGRTPDHVESSPYNTQSSPWTDKRIDLLKRLWADGTSASAIASRLGDITKNSVISKARRLGLEPRNSIETNRQSGLIHAAYRRGQMGFEDRAALQMTKLTKRIAP